LNNGFWWLITIPNSIKRLEELELPFRYGDASDVEFLDELPIASPKLVVSTIPDQVINKLIIRTILAKNPRALVILIAHTTADAQELYDAGAALVIIPHHLGAEFAAKMIKKLGTDRAAYAEEKQKHLSTLDKKYHLSIAS
jgi:Trk K+ transport system NAD-binding subunit